MCGKVSVDGVQNIVPAHQNLGYGIYGAKNHDIWAVPLCVECHAKEHSGHRLFWKDREIELIILDNWIDYGEAYPEKVFWKPLSFMKMIVSKSTELWKEFQDV